MRNKKVTSPHFPKGHFQCPKRKSGTTFNTNIPPISGKHGVRNHFWSLESGFLMMKSEDKKIRKKSQ